MANLRYIAGLYGGKAARQGLKILRRNGSYMPGVVSAIIFKSVTPDSLTVTNLYQDSYKRNAHTDFIRDTINSGIPESTKLILNADDLISSQLGPEHERVFFSIAPLEGEEEQRNSRLVDIRDCPVCEIRLEWDFVRYHHIGKAHCPVCGFTNQKAKYEVTRVNYGREKLYVEESLLEANYMKTEILKKLEERL